MTRYAHLTLRRIERWIGLPKDASQSDRLRVRFVCVICACFLVADVLCFLGAYWAFGHLVVQHGVIAASLVGKVYLIVLLRYTRNPTLLGWAFATTSILGIWLATYIDTIGQTAGFEIGAAYTPYMITSLVFVSLIGAKKPTLYYAGLGIGTLVAFFIIGSAHVYQGGVSSQSQFGLVLRCSAIAMTVAIMLPVREIIFGTLERMEAAVDRAQSAELARMEFLATMSHEIRTPLHGILALSDMLARADLDGDQGRYAELIHTSSENLMDIVNEVLDMAKLEDGGPKIVAEPFDPREVLSDLVELFSVRAANKDLWVGHQIEASVPAKLVGDALHLRQVLSNLIGNAIKFTKTGGVRIGARLAGVLDGVLLIQFYVQDSGVGIPLDQQDGIFERFKQTDSAKTSKTKGTGLGLSISRQLTELMGGQLSLSSEPGRGTVFHFTLPLPMVEETMDTSETGDPEAKAA